MNVYTNGPWMVQDVYEGIIPVDAWDGEQTIEIARVSDDNLASGKKEQEANAQLIAAAPDLLHALKLAAALHPSNVTFAEAILKAEAGYQPLQ